MGFLGWGGIGQGIQSAGDNFTRLFLGIKQLQEEKSKREAQQNIWNAQTEELKAQAAQRQQDIANKQRIRDYVGGLLNPGMAQQQAADFFNPPADWVGEGYNMPSPPPEISDALSKIKASNAQPQMPDTKQLLTGMLSAGADPEKIASALAVMANTDTKMESLIDRQNLKNEMWGKYIDAKMSMEEAKTNAQQVIAQAKLDNALEQIKLAASLGKWDRQDKDPNIAINRAQQMAQRDLKTKYAYDNLTGQYLDDAGKPVPRANILREYTDLYNKYMGVPTQNPPVNSNAGGIIKFDKNGRRIQ